MKNISCSSATKIAAAILIGVVLSNSMFAQTQRTMSEKKQTMLCLGDSYTIGEAVSETERFPNYTTAFLDKEKHVFEKPIIIARTGWTTDELRDAIHAWEKETPFKTYDVVTLLIGVNNQYRERDLKNYREEFCALLQTALKYAGGKTKHVYVLSIPDWGVTPFVAQDGKQRTGEKISEQIIAFNKVNREEAIAEKVNYINITPISQKAKTDVRLLAEDGLHPSGKMYEEWARFLAAAIKTAHE